MAGSCNDFPLISQKLQLIPVMYQPVCMKTQRMACKMSGQIQRRIRQHTILGFRCIDGNGKGPCYLKSRSDMVKMPMGQKHSLKLYPKLTAFI